jgi:2-hydroxy-6-oxonona-2,4-dienedioate hydrolase
VTHETTVSATRWGTIPGKWVDGEGWIGEWMTIGGETWFSRIHPDGDPDLPPIVMVHGLVVSGTYFRPIARIMGRRYRIYVPDLPGYGHSDSSRMWTMPSLVTQLATWMDAHHLSGAVIVANSLGVQMSTLLATTRPDLVRSLILIGPTRDPDVSGPVQLMLRGLKDIPRERQSLWSIWIPDLLRAGLRRSLFMLGQLFADNQLARLGDVRQRVLVVGGERDPIAPAHWVRDLASRVPRGEALIVRNASHAMNYSDAVEMATAIDRAIDLPI